VKSGCDRATGLADQCHIPRWLKPRIAFTRASCRSREIVSRRCRLFHSFQYFLPVSQSQLVVESRLISYIPLPPPGERILAGLEYFDIFQFGSYVDTA
jgi:hypothetical protein